MGAIHFSDMLRLLDQAYQHRTLVDVAAWEGGTGKVLHYKGWLVHHVNWRGGYIRLRNPKNRELRTLPQIFIFFINNKRVFLLQTVILLCRLLRPGLMLTASAATISCRRASGLRVLQLR